MARLWCYICDILAEKGDSGLNIPKHTFIHIPGIGPVTERWLWLAGLETWEAYVLYRIKVFKFDWTTRDKVPPC